MAEKRVELIDVFRGIAILLVVLYHFTARLPAAAVNVVGTPAPPVVFGLVGVYFFYAISGYCILLTLERSSSLAAFLARRFSRIYPAFAAAAVLLFLYGLMAPLPSVPDADFHARPSTGLDLLLNLVFLGDGRWINGSFWSIAVEVKFYVLLAAMAAFVRDAARLARIFAWVAVLAAPVWMAAAIYGDLGHSTLPARLISLTTIAPYLPFFAVGILARMRQAGKLRAPLLLAAAQAEGMGFLILDTGDGGATGWGAGLLSAVVMLVLFQLLIRYADGKALPHIPYLSGGLAKIGFISFSWYLIHENLGIGFLATLDRYLPAWAAVLVALAATLLIASVFSEAVEWRFRKPAERLALNVLGRIAPARLKGPLATGRGA